MYIVKIKGIDYTEIMKVFEEAERHALMAN